MILFYRSLGILVRLIEIFIIVRIFMSFVNLGRHNLFSQIVYEITEPILFPARRIIEKLGINTGMFDFSPLVAMLILRLIYDIIGRIIF